MITTRRTFIKKTGALVAASTLGVTGKKTTPRLAFSTLGCPKWPLEKIIKTAVLQKYEAIEFRGLEGELFLPKRAEFSTAIAETRRLFTANNIKVCNLGSSTNLHHANPVKRQKNLDEAKRFIDLAGQLSCPYIRVFPNDLPKDQDHQQTLTQIGEGLLELGEYANGTNMTVLLESHGEVVRKDIKNHLPRCITY